MSQLDAAFILSQWTHFTGAWWINALIWAIGFIFTIFWIWMLMVAITYERTPLAKVLWFLFVLILLWLGAATYYVVRHMKRGRAVTAEAANSRNGSS
jgi:signal transduction histidine kinase